MKKIVFTGGGTVGHVTLNLLLMPKFIEDGWEVHYIGDKRGIEHQEILKSGLGVTFHSIATGKLRRYFSWQNMLDVFKVGWGIVQSLFIMFRLRPQALFSKGGFVSVPPVIAARVSGVPVFIHESDLSMGLANKIAYKFATKMYSTFEQASSLSKVEHVGAVTKVSDQNTLEPDELVDIQTHFNPKLPTVLFVGGSAGARVFNQLVTDHKKELTERYNIINLTGDSSLSRGDQIENAAYFVKKGYAEELQESDLTLDSLEEKLSHLLSHKEDYQAKMKASKELKSLADFYELLKKDLS